MSNNYYDTTGVLHLKTVTPVIKALFGGMSLDASYPGNGQAYICDLSEGSSNSWVDVIDTLKDLAGELGVSWEGAYEGGVEDGDHVIWAIAKHFNVPDLDWDWLAAEIEAYSFEGDDSPDLNTLFYLAYAFDDGHGLFAIATETGWHCDKPRLFEFGGSGEYIGTNYRVCGSSTDFVQLGRRIDKDLADDNIGAAAKAIADFTDRLLAGVADERLQLRLRRAVAKCVKTG